VHPEVQESYDLDTTFMCELDFSKLHRGLKTAKKVSKFQSSSRDLSIIVPQDMSYEKIKSVLTRNAPTELVNFYPVDKYSNQSLGENISLSLRFVLQSNEKTLEEEDITSSMNQILEALNNELGIRIR
jgi:phenylalanyl-tRNA synthetase beta chain